MQHMQTTANGTSSMKRKCLTHSVFIVRIFAVLLTVGCLQASAEGFSQKISLSVKNTPLVKVFQQIEKQSGYSFIYAKEQVEKMKPVDLHVVKADLQTVLQMLFREQSLTYTISGGNIIIKEKPIIPIQASYVEQAPPFTVRGKIVNEVGAPMEGVSVVLKTSNVGVVTGADGVFSIEVPEAGDVLIFSYVGYENMERKVSAASTINLTLKQKETESQEVVVVGYGGVRKSDLTGSVSSVKSKELTAYPATSAVQALQGRAAGVLVQANNGNPGGGFKIRVRGGTSVNASSDPIFVVDGFAGALLPPPEDIESMEILKDASATAIYGSRGANGVIMITTKRGKSGKPRIEINSSYSGQEEINRLDLLNANEFVGMIKEVNPNYAAGTANTDWQNEIFRKGSIQNHQLSFAGGTDAIHYYVSGSYFDQKGVISNSAFRRASVTSNLDFNATNWLKIGLNLFAQSSKETGVITQEGSGGTTNTGVVAGAFKFGPDLPVLKPDGTYSTALIGDPHDNPYATANERQSEDIGDRLQYNVYADFSITKDLKFKTTFGGFNNNGRAGVFVPTTLVAGRNVGGAASVNGSKIRSFINENFVTYTKQFNAKHNISLLGGFSYQKFTNESWGGSSQSFLTNSVSFWNLAGGSVSQPANSALTESQLASYYARVNYNFSDRFLLTFNGRYDGSSNFSKNYKWAFFPSGALAWNMHNEKFMSGLDFISNFKWRLSYGLTGNQAINPYQTLARFSSVFTILNGVAVNAVRPTTIANENLKWETTAQQNIGVDIGFLQSRINVTADYYISKTSDLLFNVQLPQYSGYTTQLKNIGEIENKGFEFALNTKNLVGKFQWSTDFNISFNRNKVVALPGGIDIIYAQAPGHMVGISGSAQVLRVGQPVGSFLAGSMAAYINKAIHLFRVQGLKRYLVVKNSWISAEKKMQTEKC
jgi:TonB-linked SusC/RagA family outer membrane protein